MKRTVEIAGVIVEYQLFPVNCCALLDEVCSFCTSYGLILQDVVAREHGYINVSKST